MSQNTSLPSISTVPVEAQKNLRRLTRPQHQMEKMQLLRIKELILVFRSNTMKA